MAALLVGDVVAQAEVAGCAATGGMRLGRRPVGLARGDPAGRPVRPLLVVGEPEGIELALELGDRACRRLVPEPALQGLVEALDLALGLGMSWGAVLLAHTEVGEQVLEAVPATGEAGGVDRSVVGERGGGPAVRIAGRAEGGHHVVPGDPPERHAGEQVAGVVVEPADDLDLAAIGEPPVGEVGLPALVGCRGLEPDPRAARALARLGDDETRRAEDPADGRGRRGRPPSRPRCQAIVTGPASSPRAISSRRRATIRSRVASGVWPGLDRGRRERGSRASSPPSR
jgi:hypothetical protein